MILDRKECQRLRCETLEWATGMLRAAGPDKAEDVFFAVHAALTEEPRSASDEQNIAELEVAWEEVREEVEDYRWREENPRQAEVLRQRHAEMLAQRLTTA